MSEENQRELNQKKLDLIAQIIGVNDLELLRKIASILDEKNNSLDPLQIQKKLRGEW
jgi:hypothetical protein